MEDRIWRDQLRSQFLAGGIDELSETAHHGFVRFNCHLELHG